MTREQLITKRSELRHKLGKYFDAGERETAWKILRALVMINKRQEKPMTEKGVKLTKSIARWAIIILALHFGYSLVEFIRHWIVDGLDRHAWEHGINVPISLYLLIVCYPAACELFNEI